MRLAGTGAATAGDITLSMKFNYLISMKVLPP